MFENDDSKSLQIEFWEWFLPFSLESTVVKECKESAGQVSLVRTSAVQFLWAVVRKGNILVLCWKPLSSNGYWRSDLTCEDDSSATFFHPSFSFVCLTQAETWNVFSTLFHSSCSVFWVSLSCDAQSVHYSDTNMSKQFSGFVCLCRRIACG